MSELLDKRIKMTWGLALLIQFINSKPSYACAIGQDGLKHMPGSLHFQGLAEDILIYKDGAFLQDTEEYRFAGTYWKSLDPEFCWGGDFSKPDGDHFSIGYGGKK